MCHSILGGTIVCVGVLLHAVQKVTDRRKGCEPRRLHVQDALNAPGQASGDLVLDGSAR